MPSPSTPYNPFLTLEEKLDLLLSICQRPAPEPEPKKEAERVLTKEQVSEFLNISVVTVWQWEKNGILQSYRIGNLKRFKHSEVMATPKKILR